MSVHHLHVLLNPCSLCLSLDELATNTSWFKLNTALIFLPGIHTLSTKFSIFNSRYLSLLSESSNSSVECQQNRSFEFYGTTEVRIGGLQFIGCKCDVVSVKQLSIKHSTFQEKITVEQHLRSL